IMPAPAEPEPASLDDLTTVHLDVIVTDRRGDPIRHLTARDFSVSEGDGTRPLESVAFHPAAPLPAAAQGGRSGAAGNGRVFGLLLDDYHVAPGAATRRARDALTRFLDDDLRPDDSVVVMRPLDQTAALRVTRDRAAVRAALDAFTGRLGDDTPRNAFEREFMGRAPAAVDAARAQMVLSALETLGAYMAGLPEGRKTLILVSSGFEPGPRRPRVRLPGVEAILRIAGRFDLAIYPVDPDPPAAADAGRLAVLREFAARTSGTLIASAGDLGPALHAMAQDAGAYYLLTFKAPQADGRFHEITVRVKRPGAQVRARPAYWVPSLDDVRLVREAARVRAEPAPPLMLLQPSHTSGLIRSWVGIARGTDGRARITITWEPNRAAISQHLPVQADSVEVTATTPGGASIFKGTLGPATGASAAGGPPDQAAFDAPAGALELSLLIRADGRSLDTDVRHIDVPALNQARLVLTTPEIFRAFNAREYAALRDDANATPAAAAEFSRMARLLIRIRAYAQGTARPVVTARLLNLAGEPMQALTAIPAPAGEEQVTQFDLPLIQFPPGDYTIEFTATGGGTQARTLLPLRIIG
ncbi:MAG TPA: VWA domain-containing protein, partial [Vicinamibacterales bacterium]|nr:VWA domain-containing protein [Vicinamibacterales bacterium]